MKVVKKDESKVAEAMKPMIDKQEEFTGDGQPLTMQEILDLVEANDEIVIPGDFAVHLITELDNWVANEVEQVRIDLEETIEDTMSKVQNEQIKRTISRKGLVMASMMQFLLSQIYLFQEKKINKGATLEEEK